MILPDLPVLLYAFNDTAPGYARYGAWLDTVLNGDQPYGISPVVLSNLVRTATSRSIYSRPAQLEEALQFCNDVMAPERCQIVTPGPRHWSIFQDLCLKSRAQGNQVADAWLAALAIEWGCEWVTTNSDFGRFPGLRWRPPF